MAEIDDKFFDRADAHIHLSNDQCREIGSGKVSASMLYAAARFNAWISAARCGRAKILQASRDETIEYFVAEYRKMLEENLDDYIKNFDDYMATDDEAGDD